MKRRLLNKDECFAFNALRRAMDNFIKIIDNKEKIHNKLSAIKDELRMSEILLVDNIEPRNEVVTIFEPEIYTHMIKDVVDKCNALKDVMEKNNGKISK